MIYMHVMELLLACELVSVMKCMCVKTTRLHESQPTEKNLTIYY